MSNATTSILQRHYTPQEIAESLKLSEDTVRRLFQDVPGVVKITKGKRLRGKREYVSLRIPESILEAFLRSAR